MSMGRSICWPSGDSRTTYRWGDTGWTYTDRLKRDTRFMGGTLYRYSTHMDLCGVYEEFSCSYDYAKWYIGWKILCESGLGEWFSYIRRLDWRSFE